MDNPPKPARKGIFKKHPVLVFTSVFFIGVMLLFWIISQSSPRNEALNGYIKRKIAAADVDEKIDYLHAIRDGREFVINTFPYYQRYVVQPTQTQQLTMGARSYMFQRVHGNVPYSVVTHSADSLYTYVFNHKTSSFKLLESRRGMLTLTYLNTIKEKPLFTNFEAANFLPPGYFTAVTPDEEGKPSLSFFKRYPQLEMQQNSPREQWIFPNALSQSDEPGQGLKIDADEAQVYYWSFNDTVVYTAPICKDSLNCQVRDTAIDLSGYRLQDLKVTNENCYILVSENNSLSVAELSAGNVFILEKLNGRFFQPGRTAFLHAGDAIYASCFTNGVLYVKRVNEDNPRDFDKQFVFKNYNPGFMRVSEDRSAYQRAGVLQRNSPWKKFAFESNRQQFIYKINLNDDRDSVSVLPFQSSIAYNSVESASIAFTDRFTYTFTKSRYDNQYNLRKFEDSVEVKLDHADSVVMTIFGKDEIVPVPYMNNLSFYVITGSNLAFFFVTKETSGEYSYELLNPTINWKDVSLKVSVKPDPYFLIVAISLLVSLYAIGCIIVKETASDDIDISSFKSLDKIPSLRQKLITIEDIIASLKVRSDTMLILGILFGVGGVVVSYVVFTMASGGVKSWSEPQTVLNIVRPVVLLIFIETFTFYFLKQYRIIFNEYKLFYSIYFKILNYCHIYDLYPEINTIPGDLQEKMGEQLLTEKFELYEANTRVQINEFDNAAINKLIDKLLSQKGSGGGTTSPP